MGLSHKWLGYKIDSGEHNAHHKSLEREYKAQKIRNVRLSLGMTQADFAERFCLPIGSLRDWEQARTTAPDYALAYILVIADHQDLVMGIVED